MKELRGHLLDERRSDWSAGWRFCQQAGPSVVPALWRLWEESRANPKRRCIVLAAIALAGGVGEAVALERVAGTGDRAERVMALTLLALLPDRLHSQPRWWSRVVRAGDPEVVQVAALLAAARLPDGPGRVPDLGRLVRGGDVAEPGLLAAAAAAAVEGATRSAAPWWQADDHMHAPLVWRGLCLAPWRGGAGVVPVGMDQVRGALSVLERVDESLLATRRAAALHLAAVVRGDSGRVADIVERMPRGVQCAELVPEFGLSPGLLQRLPTDWGALNPSGLLVDRQLAAIAAARSRSPAAVLLAAETWAGDPDTRQSLCWHLAARLAAAPRPGAAQLQGAIERIPVGPDGDWVRWAMGQALPAPGARMQPEASPLETLRQLAVSGDLPRTAVARALEGFLWERRWHGWWAVERSRRALVRDLLLAGSKLAQARLSGVDPSRIYRVGGLPADESAFQPVAVAFYRFLEERPGPLPSVRSSLDPD